MFCLLLNPVRSLCRWKVRLSQSPWTSSLSECLCSRYPTNNYFPLEYQSWVSSWRIGLHVITCMGFKWLPYTWLFWRALNLANWSENVIGKYKFGEYSNIDSVHMRVRVHVRSARVRSSRRKALESVRYSEIRWCQTKFTVATRGRRRHNGWLFEVLVVIRSSCCRYSILRDLESWQK